MSFKLILGDNVLNENDLQDFNQSHKETEQKWKSDMMGFAQQWLNEVKKFKIHTSGSTGKPKEIEVDRKDLELSAKTSIVYFNLKEGSTALLCLPESFIAGKLMFVRAVLADLQLFANKPSSNPLKDFGRPVDFIAITPHQLHEILNDSFSLMLLEQCDQVIVGGGQIGLNDLQVVRKMKNNIWATYGMTETLTHIALCKLKDSKFPLVYELINNHFKLSVDNESCLHISTPYAHAKFIQTNDVCELINDNSFVIKGRIDNVINSGGIKIFPESIELKISSLLKDPFFIGSKEDETLGEQVVLFIQAEPYTEQKSDELLSIVKSSLDHNYEAPRSIEFMSEFIYTESGKINRRASGIKI